MRKRNIIILAIILMAVGFATITTNLIINGNTTVSNNKEDYDIRFTKAILEGNENNSLIGNNGKEITYETSTLTNVGDKSELVYEISNNSSQYDAEVSINCVPTSTITHTSYYTINTSNTPGTIKAKKSARGSIIVTLTQLSTETIKENFKCTLTINAVERTSIGKEEAKVYGVKRLINSSDTKWERIEDSFGLVASATKDGSAVQNDFDNIYPWNNIITYNYDDTTKTETAYIGEDNFKFDGSNGQVLTRIPEFYYKREQKDGYEYIYISGENREGYTKSESFSVGRYTMSAERNSDNAVEKGSSKSGVMPLRRTTITNFRAYARKLGSDFGQLDYRYFILQLLYLVEYADYDSQSVLGLGNTSNTAVIASGGCDTLLMKSGTLNNDGKNSVIYRGIEDIFGNVWQFVDGINIKDYVAYINYNPDTYESDIFDGDYKMLEYTNGYSTGFIAQLGYDSNQPLIGFPITTGGSKNTYISDYYYWPSSGNRVARIGGGNDVGFNAGLWYCDFSAGSLNESMVGGSRLLRYQ